MYNRVHVCINGEEQYFAVTICKHDNLPFRVDDV